MAFVKYVGVDGDERAARWNTVAGAIKDLAQGQSRVISLGEDEAGDVFMVISRCLPSGFYVSVRAAGEPDEYDLVRSFAPSELLECVVGAGRQTVSSDAIVEAPAVEEAARQFFLTGKRLESAAWRKTEERYQRLAKGEPVQKR
jgi:hypothetical protein